jgi:exodeoxyribonuclease VII small subunit
MKNMSFEKALAELEAIVGKLEAGELSLDESLAVFEKGVEMARFLRTELEKAEKKVEILLKDAEGKIQPEPFDLSEDKNPEKETPEKDSPENDNQDNGNLPF